MAGIQFDKSFIWGVATASYQIEGATGEDGRGESIWDRFSRTPGKTYEGHTGDVACDHYHRYKEDVALIKSLGVRSYRFSIAWPRIFPEGYGAPNQKGLDFYKRLLEELHNQGLTPAATLYHWDLPQALQDQGGWLNRETAHHFAGYADIIFREIGDQVPLWITHNEPWCAGILSHALGHHAPGMTDWSAGFLASHHLLLSHGMAVQAYRAAGLKGQIGITLNLTPAEPYSESPEDQRAARLGDGFSNRWFLDPVFRGEYPADMVQAYGEFFTSEWVQSGDMETIAAPTDFLGVNFYTRTILRASDAGLFGVETVPGPGPVTEMGWEVTPQSLTELLVRLEREYTRGMPIYVTENGCAYPDELQPDGTVADPERVSYLKQHFAACHSAMQAGVNLKGFYVWSLMDNFEWAFGYSRRFGIVYVDYPTQRRFLKESAKYVQEVATTGRV